jgi:hypothetical protein
MRWADYRPSPSFGSVRTETMSGSKPLPDIYRVNAVTIFNVAHDASMSEAERKDLIARLLQMMACDQPVERPSG